MSHEAVPQATQQGQAPAPSHPVTGPVAESTGSGPSGEDRAPPEQKTGEAEPAKVAPQHRVSEPIVSGMPSEKPNVSEAGEPASPDAPGDPTQPPELEAEPTSSESSDDSTAEATEQGDSPSGQEPGSAEDDHPD